MTQLREKKVKASKSASTPLAWIQIGLIAISICAVAISSTWQNFQTLPFKSTKFNGDASGGTLTGTLTFLGFSKIIEFPITKIGEGKDPWGGYRVGFEGLYKMTRKDFGMDFNLGPAAEFVDVTLQIEAIRDK